MMVIPQIGAPCHKSWESQWLSPSDAAAAAKLLQSCPTLCNPIDSSPPGSPVPGILQVRTLEWVAMSFSNAWKWKVKVKSLSRVQLLATPWTIAYWAPPSMGFSRQEYWSGLPLPSPTYISFCKMHQHYDSLEVLKFYDGAPDDAMLNPISHVSTKQVFSSFSFWCFWILAFQGER